MEVPRCVNYTCFVASIVAIGGFISGWDIGIISGGLAQTCFAGAIFGCLVGVVMRVYETENAVAIQSNINEALVKALRDDTYLRNSHNHVTAVCTELDGAVRNMVTEITKLTKTVSEMQLGIDVLQQTLVKTQKATEEVARGGRLRIERRKARLVDQQHDDEPEDEFIEWGLDGFTLG